MASETVNRWIKGTVRKRLKVIGDEICDLENYTRCEEEAIIRSEFKVNSYSTEKQKFIDEKKALERWLDEDAV